MFATPLPEGAGGLGQAGPWDGCKTASHCPPSPAIIGSRVPQLRGPGAGGALLGGGRAQPREELSNRKCRRSTTVWGGSGRTCGIRSPRPPLPFSPHPRARLALSYLSSPAVEPFALETKASPS